LKIWFTIRLQFHIESATLHCVALKEGNVSCPVFMSRCVFSRPICRSKKCSSFIRQCLYSPLLCPRRFSSFVIFFTQSLALLGRWVRPSQGCYLHTDIHALSWIRTHDPSVRASEDDSWPRPRGHCDRPRALLYI
jgi:hypothetical protein